AHAAAAEVLVDRVGHDEHDRPQQRARGEAERAGLPEQVPFPGPEPERVLEREDLDPDELRQQRVDAEERGEADEQAGGAVLQQRPRRRAHASGSVAGGGTGTENGIESGDTAPPEMMKAIASSTVQSVGVIFSTGTISR